MVYLLALLIVPLTFLYSPKLEKSGTLFIAKPMLITQERKSPAYELFKQSQIVSATQENNFSREPATEQQTVNLNLHELKTEQVVLKTAQLVIDQKELLVQTDKQLQKMATTQTDSTLLSALSKSGSQQAPFQDAAPHFMPNKSQAATIRGNFELSEGVGIVDHVVSLRRVFEGQSFELGEVDLKAGMYQIQVGSFEGELVAEIKDRTGIIIGEDHEKILGLKLNGLFFSGPILKVGQPSAISLNSRNIDDRRIIDSDFSGTLFSGNYSLKKTTDTYPNVASLSSTFAFIEDRSKKNAPTLSVRTAKDSSETLLFSQKWVDGLKSYLSEKLQIQYIPASGMIIGRIMQDGKPVIGAQIIVENQPGLEPYYLDQFLIPQTNQSVTSANGFFILPGLSQGRYQISAFVKERHIGNQLYFVEDSVVSYQEILSTVKTQSIIARAFDAFNGQELDADLVLPGHEDIFSIVDGMTRYRSPAAEGLQEILVRPVSRQYASYTYLQNSRKDHLHLPLITDEFLDQLRLQKQIPTTPDTALFIAFAPAGEFDLHLTIDNFDRKQIVYFNGQGKVSNEPVPGGGFVIYNLPEGAQEIILQDQKNDRTFSQVLYAEPSKNYVAHFVE